VTVPAEIALPFDDLFPAPQVVYPSTDILSSPVCGLISSSAELTIFFFFFVSFSLSWYFFYSSAQLIANRASAISFAVSNFFFPSV
jgi:hypothetical protein